MNEKYYLTRPEVESVSRILLNVNSKPVVMIKPDGEVLIAEGVTISDASRAFWECVSNHGARLYSERARAAGTVVGEMRAMAATLPDGALRARLEGWAESVMAAVEMK